MKATGRKPLFRVKTCATCANMGPGFDSAALALDIFNECEIFSGRGKDHSIEYTGRYADDIDSGSGIVINVLAATLDRFENRISLSGKKDDETEMEKAGNGETADEGLPSSLDIRMTVNIPPGKGLGSSASAILSGLLIANKAYYLGLNKKLLLQAATELDGSPDNAAAALSGNMAVVYRHRGEYLFEKIELPPDYRVLLFIPFGKANTVEARKLIPQKVPIGDAVANIANFSLLVKYLEEGDIGGAAAFCRDHMYQKYRKALYPASLGLVEELIDTYRIPAFISGAGPTVAAIMDDDVFSGFKDIRGRITARYLSFQSLVAGINAKGSYYL